MTAQENSPWMSEWWAGLGPEDVEHGASHGILLTVDSCQGNTMATHR